MDNNENNLAPQPTGGLKLMTVFIAVLALHVVVIGGFTVYHLMSGGSSDTDLLADKSAKGVKVSPDGSLAIDNSLANSSSSDATTNAPAAPTSDTTSAPQTAPAPSAAPETTATTPATPSATPESAASTPAAPVTAPETATTEPSVPPAITPVTDATAATASAAPVTPATPLAPPAATPTATTTPAPEAPEPPMVTGPVAATPTPANNPVLLPVPNTPETAPAPALSQSPAPAATPSEPTAADASGPVKMPVTQPSARTPGHSESAHYVVKSRDTLDKIAHANHTTVAKLKAANELTSDHLRIGQKLIIPGKTLLASSHASTGAFSPAGYTFVTKSSTADASAATGPVTESSTEKPARHRAIYTVVKGDTLIKIARKFNTTARALEIANDITDPTKLGIGKKLTIPRESKESRSAKNGAPAKDQPEANGKPTATSAQLANFVQ